MDNPNILLNNILDKMNITGFRFHVNEKSNNTIIFCLMSYNNLEYTCRARWANLDKMFSDEYVFKRVLEYYESFKNNTVMEYIARTCPFNYLAINDIGAAFLKCIPMSNSLEELELKLAILGY